MRKRLPRVALTTSTFTLLASLLLEGIADIELYHLAFRAVLFGPVVFMIIWLVINRCMKARKSRLGDITVSNWEYAAEGALNVALRYRGNVKELEGRVLRLRKKPRTITAIKSSSSRSSSSFGDADDDDDSEISEDLEETLTDANQFIDQVMVPLLSRRFVPPSQVVKVNQPFIEELATHIDPDRPAKRRDAASLQKNAGVGLLMMDSAQIPCGCSSSSTTTRCRSYCFEIKPKWGFYSEETKEWEVKRRVDRFTMHQQMKKSADATSEISEYCPIDLFHGGENGIMLSLRRLAKTPQNNLRLFIDGRMKFPSSGHQLRKSLNEILVQEGNDDGVVAQDLETELFTAITEVLTKEDVLPRILKAQTIGPLNDIESVYPLYEEMVTAGETIGDVHLGYDASKVPSVPPRTSEERAEIVKRFLISCTARDCSLMITFSQCKQPTRPPLGLCLNGKWNYEITVVDLDAKPISKMHHYFQVDREIASTFTEYIRNQKNGSTLDQNQIGGHSGLAQFSSST